MTKDDLIKLVTEKASEAEDFYVNNAPRKHDQEAHYRNGVSVVQMNVELLEYWLDTESGKNNPLEDYEELPKEDRREVWEASGFHFGIYGYEEHDADFYWEHEES